jgi:hypothetical protein
MRALLRVLRGQPSSAFQSHVPGLNPPPFKRSASSRSDLIGSFDLRSTWDSHEHARLCTPSSPGYELIEYASSIITLFPGDVINTGTGHRRLDRRHWHTEDSSRGGTGAASRDGRTASGSRRRAALIAPVLRRSCDTRIDSDRPHEGSGSG